MLMEPQEADHVTGWLAVNCLVAPTPMLADRWPLSRRITRWSEQKSAQNAVQAIDRRRLSYVENLLKTSGFSPGTARARAQILYWAFVGFALSDQPLPRARQAAVLDELLRIATR